MRDLFEKNSPENPVEAVRRTTRPLQRRRFYGKAAAAAARTGYAVQLDAKPVHTPAGRLLAVPSLALAQAIAAEWDAQCDIIDPTKMPLTRLASTIIDGVVDTPRPVAAEIGKYLGSDLLFYRAETPQGLVERQAQHWDPILAWAREALGAHFTLGEGVIHVAQPEAALAAARAAIPAEPWRLGALHVVTTLTGSALLGLAMLRKRLSAEEAWRAAHVDEDWNMEQWGRDELTLERRAFRFAELKAAATIFADAARGEDREVVE
jgi:chaperone required for assembly of F1-ATPase